MTNQVLETIKRRRSVRGFKSDPVSRDLLEAIVQAGQYAPNACQQAWHFTVIQDRDLLDRLSRLSKAYAAVSGLPWLEALGKNPDFQPFYGAPAAIFVSCAKDSVTAKEDTSAATENILLAAESLGLGACWVYFATQAFLGVEGAALHRELGIPEGYHVYVSIPVGYAKEEREPTAPRKPGCVTFWEG